MTNTETKKWNVLFLCRANSARSQIAQVLLSTMAGNRFNVYSAGSHPAEQVHPLTLEVLRGFDYPLDQLRAKSWDEFAGPDAPEMDFVFTVCDDTAGEVCPTWPGQPMSAHWGFPDPVSNEGTDAQKMIAFGETLRQIRRRLEAFIALPIEKLDRLALQKHVDEIGRS
jgi:arsenate reductase (thioredoxin)